MNVNEAIAKLVQYALLVGLIEEADRIWATNGILQALQLSEYEEPETPLETSVDELEAILKVLLDDAVRRGLADDTATSRDLLDTKVMGSLTPRPSWVIQRFWKLYEEQPSLATTWFYDLNQDDDYIRRYRISKDVKWKVQTDYGNLDITINLAKPEKDPKDIAAARNAAQSGYPTCLLCKENEGYAGRLNHPARQNIRLIPLSLDGEQWFFQYSPYVYYPEHCIVLNERHVPMRIDKSTFAKLIEFVQMFPSYFIGSNADLPIVGGSILSHDHFQGGKYCFPLEMAPVETPIEFSEFPSVEAGIVKWPMSVIRLRSEDADELVRLAELILGSWRAYSDESVGIYAKTQGAPHNAITPICRMRDGRYEMDLVLRNNRTDEEHPLGIFHPHANLHHIKKENIGLIEAMGLAILPARLKRELHDLADVLVRGDDAASYPDLAKHAPWAEEVKARHELTKQNVQEVLRQEVGLVFQQVLLDAGVFKRTPEGKAAFFRFIDEVNDKGQG